MSSAAQVGLPLDVDHPGSSDGRTCCYSGRLPEGKFPHRVDREAVNLSYLTPLCIDHDRTFIDHFLDLVFDQADSFKPFPYRLFDVSPMDTFTFVLFRPVGLKLIANLISKFENLTIEERFERINKIPTNLREKPYFGLLMTRQGKMEDGNEPKVRNILLSALGVSLNIPETRSAIAGISIIREVPLNQTREKDLPLSLNQLDNI